VTHAGPRVSVGLPVHNGGGYLTELLDSLLAQTFEDFELLISDNSSTDSTASICHRYAAGDARVSYVRQRVNQGAAVNHNLVLEGARAPYFKWVGHDDRYHPGYLAACVAALDADPGAVLCHSDTVVIDLDGSPLRTATPGALASSTVTWERFREVLLVPEEHRVFEMYGLMRTQVARATGGIGPYEGSDFPFIAQMALHGRFARVREPLFENRVTPRTRYPEGHPSYDPSQLGRPRFFHARMGLEFAGLLLRHPMPWPDRLRCFSALADNWPRKLRHLAGDVTGNVRGALRRQ